MSNSSNKTLILVLLVAIIILSFVGIMPWFRFGIYHLFGWLSNMGEPPVVHFGLGPRGLITTGLFSVLPLLLLLLWIVLIMWVYRDAEKRGMNGLLWALLVFVGNIIGLIIYLIVRNEGLPPRPNLISTVTCQSCGKTVVESYTFCPHCGTRLKALCPNCKQPISNEWRVCPHCGTRLVETPIEPAE